MNYNKEDYPLLLKRKHIRKILGISDTLYYQLIRSGELPTVRLNNRTYIIRDEFWEVLKNNQKGILNYEN